MADDFVIADTIKRLTAEIERLMRERDILRGIVIIREEHIAELESVVNAVLYAMRCGCLSPVPNPKPGASLKELTRWGAMQNLHNKVAALEGR